MWDPHVPFSLHQAEVLPGPRRSCSDIPLWGHCLLTAPGYLWGGCPILILQGQTEEYHTRRREWDEGQTCLYQGLTLYLTTVGGTLCI